MKKIFRIFLGTFVLAISQIHFSQAQDLVKLGPSLLYNVSFFDEAVRVNFGLEAAYEFGIGKKWTLNTGVLFHVGEHDNTFDQNINQRNYLMGTQSDVRWYFKKKYNSGYLGFGSDLKFLVAQKYFPPTPDDPGTFTNWEFNVGITFGYLAPLDKESLNFKPKDDSYVNPFFYLGVNPSDQNEYGMNFRIGLNIGI